MEFKYHSQFDVSLKDAWNSLLSESIDHLPFLRFEYLHNWWLTRGGGEWDQNSQLVLITAHRDNTLIGIAPLFLTEHEGKACLLNLGAIEISDFLNFLVRPEDLEKFTGGLLDFLNHHPEIPPWENLELYNILESSPVIDALKKESAALKWGFKSERLQPAPYVTLSGDWETYLANIDKKQRHEIRRKIRRLENAEEKSRWYIVKDPSILDEEVQAFFELMMQDPQKEKFLTDDMKTAMRNLIHAGFDEGYLQLVFLEIDGQKAAAYLNFDYNNRIWVYNSGFDDQFLSWSPGWVLLSYLLQWANENKRHEFDFLRGDEKYKYRFGAVDRFIRKITITRT
jgi:CelD/BcsL family acetyltransferase involved in cellulose biosynthesis